MSKHAQLGRWLGELVAAVDRGNASAPTGTGRTLLLVKPHPAETDALYRDALGHSAGSRLAPAALDLATLLVACDLVVTVNSTVAIDAMALGIPALTVGMPNNLAPFVVAGGMAGVFAPSELGPALARTLWNDAARAELLARGRSCAESAGIRADGGAAARSAAALARLSARQRPSATT